MAIPRTPVLASLQTSREKLLADLEKQVDAEIHEVAERVKQMGGTSIEVTKNLGCVCQEVANYLAKLYNGNGWQTKIESLEGAHGESSLVLILS